MRVASTLEDRLRLDGNPSKITFSPDGTRLVNVGPDGSVHLWDVIEGRAIATLPGTMRDARLSFSPDGRWLAVLSNGNASVMLDGQTGALTDTIDTALYAVSAWSPSADGPVFATSGLRGGVLVWDPKTVPPTKFVLGSEPANGVAFSADGKALTCLGGEIVHVWKLSTRREVANLSLHEPTTWGTPPVPIDKNMDLHSKPSLLSPNGSLVASPWDLYSGCQMDEWQCTPATMTIVREVASGRELQRLFPAGGFTIGQDVWFTPDSSSLLTTGGGGTLGDATVRLWNLAQGKPVVEAEAGSNLLSPDGRTLMLTETQPDHSTKWYRTTDGELLRTVLQPEVHRAEYVLTPSGQVDFEGDTPGGDLVCTLGAWVFPFRVCEERCRVAGLAAKVLSGIASEAP